MLRRTAAHRIVIGDLAPRVQTTRARTRIHASLIHARSIQIALAARRALGPTVRWHTDVVHLARAHRMRVHVATLTVRAARRRHTRIRLVALLHGHRFAHHMTTRAGRRTAGEAESAAAVRRMVDHMAFGVGAARTLARILAALVAAGSLLRAVAVHDALRPALGVRIALVVGQTRAGSGAVLLVAQGVDAARRRVAWVGGLVVNDCGCVWMLGQ